MASSATWHEHIANEYSASDEAPCADQALLPWLWQSPEYDQILWRVIDANPTDSWHEDGLHFFVFQLDSDGSTTVEPPLAVFAMSSEPIELVSAVMVTPSSDGETAEVLDMREPGSSYAAPLAH